MRTQFLFISMTLASIFLRLFAQASIDDTKKETKNARIVVEDGQQKLLLSTNEYSKNAIELILDDSL